MTLVKYDLNRNLGKTLSHLFLKCGVRTEGKKIYYIQQVAGGNCKLKTLVTLTKNLGKKFNSKYLRAKLPILEFLKMLVIFQIYI